MRHKQQPSISTLAVLGYERVKNDTLKQRESEPSVSLTDEVYSAVYC